MPVKQALGPVPAIVFTQSLFNLLGRGPVGGADIPLGRKIEQAGPADVRRQLVGALHLQALVVGTRGHTQSIHSNAHNNLPARRASAKLRPDQGFLGQGNRFFT